MVKIHVERELGIPRDLNSLYGAGISLGHPPGPTGVRMCMTAIEHRLFTGGRYAMLSMCLGAGQGMAMLLEHSEADLAPGLARNIDKLQHVASAQGVPVALAVGALPARRGRGGRPKPR